MPVIGDLLTNAMAGIAFVGCALASVSPSPAPGGPAPGGPAPAGRRREVVVNGKRVKTIDIHAHCCVPAQSKRTMYMS